MIINAIIANIIDQIVDGGAVVGVDVVVVVIAQNIPFANVIQN